MRLARAVSTSLATALACAVLAQAAPPTPPAAPATDSNQLPLALTRPDTLPLGVRLISDTLAAVRDTLPAPARAAGLDSLGGDSLRRGLAVVPDTLGPRPGGSYRLSADALPEAVDYKAVDSVHYSVADQKIRLYREAEVKYTDVDLAAGSMEIDYGQRLVRATPREDSVGATVERPSFAQGPQAFTAAEIRYNYDTRKGVIYDTRTQQGDLYVIGGRTKIVAADDGDPARAENTVYNAGAIITTCELDVPHYGIHSSKQKVIAGRQVVVGPSNVELGGVPTPLWLPFGFFPIGSSERSGLLFPSNYTYTGVTGFGFEGVGWYFPWNERLHTAVTADLFLKGTIRFTVANDYNVRYRYRGSTRLELNRIRVENFNDASEGFQRSMALAWQHTQDPKAHPYRTFGASVNFETNLNSRRNNAGAFFQTNNQSTSRINYSQKFPAHPSWTLTGALTASQNFNTRIIDVRFPDLRFSTGQIFPFAQAGGSSRAWYRKAAVDYTASALGSVQSTDTTIFTAATLDDAVYGAQQQAAFSVPINVLKYFRLSPRVAYSETYFFDERRVGFRVDTTFTRDTILLDGVPVVTLDTSVAATRFDTAVDAPGFARAARDLSTTLTLTTQVFGTARFRLGPLRGLRHVMTPTVGTGWRPNYTQRPFDYFDEAINPLTGDVASYLRFPGGPISPGSFPLEQSLNFDYGLVNRVEAKVLARGDTLARNTTLLNNLRFGGSYSPKLDSLRWSPISVTGAQVALFDKLVRVNFGTQLSVYQQDEDGRLVDRTLASGGKFPFRITDFNYTVSAGLTLAKARELLVGRDRALPSNSIFELVSRFSISYNFRRLYSAQRIAEPWVTQTNTVNVSGPLPITDKWQIRSLTLGYDFESGRITYPTLAIGRDLHCWEMDFFWSPAFGNQFTFSIRVKPSSLGFLSIPYRRGAAR